MSIKLIPMKCPCCGASIENVGSLPSVTCTYCDTKFIIDHGELRKYEASDTAVFYADNKKVMEVPVESPDDRAISPAWMEAIYDTAINALKPFDSCAAVPLDTTVS